MTYPEVERIVGVDVRPQPGMRMVNMDGAAGMARDPSESVYTWVNPDGSTASCIFTNGRLSGKMQFGIIYGELLNHRRHHSGTSARRHVVSGRSEVAAPAAHA
jgi:hypothetical protein